MKHPKFDPPELAGAICMCLRVEGNSHMGKVFPDNEKKACSKCRSMCWVRPYNAHREIVCTNCLEVTR